MQGDRPADGGSREPATQSRVTGRSAPPHTARKPLLALVLLAALAGLSVTLAASEALAMHPSKRPRPNDVPPGEVVTETAPNGFRIFNDYATPERTFSSRRTVVHYVVLGIDAPPLNDDDGNEVPDYVERIGEAADTAITYYERREFKRIRPDTGGPDARPDLYLSRFAPGYFGLALPGWKAEGGAFAALSNSLDPTAGVSFASLYGTVAHELFHLVQFSYYPADADPALPVWVREGVAAAMESRVYPDLDDLVTEFNLRHWFAEPDRTIAAHAYGPLLLWRYLDVSSPALLDAFLRRLAARPGPQDARDTLVTTYARLTDKRFADTFADFAVRVAGDFPDRITPLRRLATGGRFRGGVAPLAIHYVRLRVPRQGRYAVTVSLPAERGALRATLVYQLESDTPGSPSQPHRILPRSSNGGTLTFTVPPHVRKSERFFLPTLVVSNGATRRSDAYTVSSR